MAGAMGRVQCCAQSPLPAVRGTKPRVLALSGEILIGSAIIAISLLYASRAPASSAPRVAPEVARRDEKWLKSNAIP